jgi:hypothetical protein
MIRHRFAALLTATLPGLACTPGGDALEETPAPPYAELARVDLTESPKNEVLANFYCRDLVSDLVCDFVFDDPPPEKSTLKFSFETVFELGNPNSFSVPMVELLLAFKVFEGERQSELAALCVSFCDPAAEDCEAKKPEEACQPPDKTVRSLEDFVPTVDDLVRVAKQAVDGTLDDNLSFRMIPARSFQRCRPLGTTCEPCEASALSPDAGLDETPESPETVEAETICCGDEPAVTLASSCHLAENEAGEFCELCDGEVESRVRFDLGVDAITNILSEVAADSIDALSEGELPSFDIPYSVEGTLFFDVPVLGRFALSFGPFSSTWSLD